MIDKLELFQVKNWFYKPAYYRFLPYLNFPPNLQQGTSYRQHSPPFDIEVMVAVVIQYAGFYAEGSQFEPC